MTGCRLEALARLLVASALALGLSACGGGGSAATDTGAASLSAAAQLGEHIFSDVSLSASGRQSCATCHVPSRGHAPDNALPAQPGGADMLAQGTRDTPSIRYLRDDTAFHFASDGTPTGGFFWDGRAASLAAQAAQPFLNPLEMANADKAAVVAKLARAAYAQQFRQVYGDNIFADADAAFQRMTLAVQAYEQEDADFAPFTSKYDAFLHGQTTLSAQELRGLALFNNPLKGNCSACHPSGKSVDGTPPLFTDFSYDNLGVPRNWDLVANQDPRHFDLGLCASVEVADLPAVQRDALCGAFKVPSLRNVALRQSFFHNGRFHTLKDALTFYVQRDLYPEKFYLKADGSVDCLPDGSVNKFNDLPSAYHRNVNTQEGPYNRHPGDAPALSDAEIDDVIAFLGTLSDGWSSAP